MILTGRAIAVTGASGFIGRALVRALLGRGALPVAVVRSPDKLAVPSIDKRKADLCDVPALTRALEGCDAVIANAGLVSIGAKSREALTQANVEGTRNVLLAAKNAGVRRVLLTSSATVYERRPGRAYEEPDPLWHEGSRVGRNLYYSVSKAIAEREAWRLAEQHDLDLTVARPGGVYGEHDHSGLTPWLERLASVPLVTVFPAYLYVPMVYVDDLAEVMLRMLERPVSSGQAYNVAGDPEISFWHLMEAYREATGRSPVVLPIPMPLRITYSTARAKRDLDFESRLPRAAFADLVARRAPRG